MQFYETAKVTFFSSGETKADGVESVAEGVHLLEGQISTNSNTDGSTKGNSVIGGFGGVFRNNRGDWVLGYMKGIPHTTTILAEVHAFLQGLQLD